MDRILHEILDPNRPWGALLLAGIFLAVALFAAKLLRFWTRRLASHSTTLIDQTTVSYFGRFAQLICFLAAAIMYAHLIPALQRLGEALLTSAGVVSLVIGLAAQNTLGNLISGVSLLLYRPFSLGDVLTINTPTGKETGTVKEFSLGYTKLMTEDGRWIIVPNSSIASNIIIRVKEGS
ncbi:MAG: mechanosensitive ion channel family protein [Tepidisphaeraceae bacterium]|jgi:small-conductance mechanosensitive channel